eukprot:4602867-Amphidinium_carterae.1
MAILIVLGIWGVGAITKKKQRCLLARACVLTSREDNTAPSVETKSQAKRELERLPQRNKMEVAATTEIQ